MAQKILICALVLMCVCIADAEADTVNKVTVQVSEPLLGRDEHQVRQAARLKAQALGITRLPIVISGKEVLSGEEYSSEIQALTASSVQVDTINENWDHDIGMFNLEASVYVDMKASLMLINEIKQNAHAKRDLKDLQDRLEQLANKNSVTVEDVIHFQRYRVEILSGILARNTLAESIAARKALISELNALVGMRVNQFAGDTKMEVIEVTPKAVVIRLVPKEPWSHYLEQEKALFSVSASHEALWVRVMGEFPRPCLRITEGGKGSWDFIDLSKPLAYRNAMMGLSVPHNGDDEVLQDLQRYIRVSSCKLN